MFLFLALTAYHYMCVVCLLSPMRQAGPHHQLTHCSLPQDWAYSWCWWETQPMFL